VDLQLTLNSPFYKKAENFTAPENCLAQEHKLFYDRDSLGTEGPLPVSYLKEFSRSHQYWHETLHHLNVPTNHAHLSGSNVGAWTSVTAVDPETATRAYSTSAYYLPNAKRPNLFVLTGATVQEIIIEPYEGDLVAKGARFLHADGQFIATASKEVILSAGSVASPQILECSGIGNPSVLEPAGIAVKVANPNLGENLQDHISKLHTIHRHYPLSELTGSDK
jgi:choline dehydrogenase-like flavoprotein